LILNFLQRARNRFVWNEVIAQIAFAGALFMGGAVLLLLTGTQLLDWRLVGALCIVGFGAAIYRTLRRVPSVYKVAMLVDARTGLHDALSTAYFFLDPGKSAKLSADVVAVQRSTAESMIPAVNLETAIPFQFPRAVYAMGVLGLVASSLFAVRYGTSKQLDWKAPISQLIIESLGLKDPEAKTLAKNQKPRDGKAVESLDDAGNPLPRSQDKKGDLDASPATSMDNPGDPDPNNEKAETGSTKPGDGKGEATEQADQSEGDKGDTATPAAGKNAADNPSGSQDGQQQGEQSAGKQNSANNSSLLSKMKEAMSNLLSKAKPQANQANGQKQNSGQQGSQKAQSQQSGEKGAQDQSQKGDGKENADSQQGQQAGESDDSQDSQGKGSGKNSDQQSAAQPGSGIGKQDGAKDVKAAEQRAAMGKLSEIIGKRAANVSGEMMLDNQSGPQQLKTNYTTNSATHSAAGGDVNRDEVPVALQGYVQQYFEEVRKAERAAPAASKKTPKSGSDAKPSSSEK
jgi:hypothetical protein